MTKFSVWENTDSTERDTESAALLDFEKDYKLACGYVNIEMAMEHRDRTVQQTVEDVELKLSRVLGCGVSILISNLRD